MPENLSEYKYDVMKRRKCQYPECKELFEGTGYSKYCIEHRKKQYRKVIDKLNKKIIVLENSNQIYRHGYDIITIVELICDLCGDKFKVKLYPNIYVYPKYCDAHRNPFKRMMWKKRNATVLVPVIESYPGNTGIDDNTFVDFEDDNETIDTVN